MLARSALPWQTMNPLVATLRLPLVVARHSELLGSFVKRELRARIHGSILGRFWPIIQPALLFAIYFLIFSKLLRIGFSDTLAPHGEENEGWRSTFYLITGILPWTCFAESVTRGTSVVLENANLIKKIAFPSELLPIYTTLVYHVYFALGFVIFLLLELVVNGSLPWPGLLWLPLVMILQFAFICGLSLFLSAANVFVRDFQQAVPIVLTFWMFTTPVFYDLGALLEQAPPGSREYDTITLGMQVMGYNPMAQLLGMYRSVFTFGAEPFPMVYLARFSLVTVGALMVGYTFFLRSKGRFADEV